MMVAQGLAFLMGVLWVQTRASLDGLPLMITLLMAAVIGCASAFFVRGWPWCKSIAWFLAVVAAGIAWTGVRAHWQLAELTLKDPQRSDYQLMGSVVSIPELSEGRVQFDFEPEAAFELGLPQRLRLSWYDEPAKRGVADVKPQAKAKLAAHGVQHRPRAAERWQLEVRVKPPHGFANPGGFDHEGQLFREGIGAIGYVRASAYNKRISIAGWRYPVLRVRATIVERMQQVLGESAARGVAIGLAVGVTHEIQPRQWEVFRATGITHLIAISGLHVTMIAVVAMMMVRVVWWLPWQPRLRSCRADIAALVGAVAAAAYAILAGFSVPTQRTLIMFVVALAAVWLRRSQPPSQVLAVSLLAVLMFDPHAALSPGFWLSFLAVAGILWVAVRSRERRPLREFLSVQAAVSVMLIPATLLLFGSLSIVAPLVNLVAIPFFSFLLVPGLLVGLGLMAFVPAAGAAVVRFTAYSFESFWPLMQWAADLPGAWVHLPAPGPLLAITLGMTAIVLISPLPGRLKAIGALMVFPLFFQASPRPPLGGVQLTVLDVGQGLAVFVRTRQHALLYDAGPSFRTGRSAGELAVAPFLWSLGVDRLDRMVVSHPDSDHAGGVAAVLKAVEIASFRYGGMPPPVSLCQQGEAWEWDGVRFEFLHPAVGQRWSDNDGSCVLSITSKGGRVLLTGDVQARAERNLLTHPRALKAEVVVVPHHGSRSSSTAEFVAAVGARYAVVSAGHRNRWGFPDSAVVQRWCKQGAEVMGTAEWGAVMIEIHPLEGIAPPRAHRRQFHRYWHDTPAVAGHSLCYHPARQKPRSGHYVGNHPSRRAVHVAFNSVLGRRRRHHS